MEMKNSFNVQLPIETFEDWIRQDGVDTGYILENQQINIGSASLNSKTGYVEISGDIISRLDS